MRLPPLPPSLWESPTQGPQTFQELAVWADQLLVQDGPQARVLGRLLGSMLRAPELTMELAVDGVSSSASSGIPELGTTAMIVRCAGSHHLNVPGLRQWGPGVGTPLAGSAYLLPAWEVRPDYVGWKLHYDAFTRLTLYPQRLDLVEDVGQ